VLDETYKDRVVPDAKYLSKRSNAGSRARQAAAKAGAGGAHVCMCSDERTFSSRVKQLSRTPRLLPDEQSADTHGDHGVARGLFSPFDLERPESDCNVTKSPYNKTLRSSDDMARTIGLRNQSSGSGDHTVPTVVHVDAMHPEESRSCRWLRGKVRTLDAANDYLEEELGDLRVEHAALIAQVAELREKLSILEHTAKQSARTAKANLQKEVNIAQEAMALQHQAQRAEFELQIATLKDTLKTERSLHSAKQAIHQHELQAARKQMKQEHEKIVSGLQAQAAALRAAYQEMVARTSQTGSTLRVRASTSESRSATMDADRYLKKFQHLKGLAETLYEHEAILRERDVLKGQVAEIKSTNIVNALQRGRLQAQADVNDQLQKTKKQMKSSNTRYRNALTNLQARVDKLCGRMQFLESYTHVEQLTDGTTVLVNPQHEDNMNEDMLPQFSLSGPRTSKDGKLCGGRQFMASFMLLCMELHAVSGTALHNTALCVDFCLRRLRLCKLALLPSDSVLKRLPRCAYYLNLIMGSRYIALDSVDGHNLLATDGTQHRKHQFLSWNGYWQHAEGGTKVFSPGIVQLLHERGEEMCKVTVRLFEAMEAAAKKALSIEYKLATESKASAVAVNEVASNAGLRGLFGTLADHAANETNLNELLGHVMQRGMARFGCTMHLIENDAKAGIDADTIAVMIEEDLAKVADEEQMDVSSLKAPGLPTEKERFAGKPGESGMRKASELLKCAMGSAIGAAECERRATFKEPFNNHQRLMAQQTGYQYKPATVSSIPGACR
jgi:hypothetical protein